MSLRILAGLSGALLLYAALFLYEDEQGRIQNKLEEWWIRMGEREVVALRRHTAFIKEVARSAGIGFESLLGERLFSEQALTVSLYYSMASYTFAVMIARSVPILARSAPSRLLLFSDSRLAATGLILTFIVLGSLPAFVEVLGESRLPSRFDAPVWPPGPETNWKVVLTKTVWANLAYFWLPLVFFSILGMTRHDMWELMWPNSPWHLRVLPGWKARMAVGAILVLGGFACAVCFIAVTRWALRLSSRSYRLGKIVAVVVVNFLVGSLLVLGPLLLARYLSGAPDPSAGVRTARSPGLLMALGLSNSIDALAALVFFLLALTLLAHRIFWPLLRRPLYALQALGVARRRKLFGGVGVGLLSFAGVKFPDVIKKIIETVAG